MEKNLQKKFFIIIGRSGSGKGTQAALLQGKLEDTGISDVHHLTTGGGFREFIKSNSYIAKLSREINDTGALQPEFLAVWAWADMFINKLHGGETIILDGAPRKPFEAGVLHSAISFMGYTDPIVIYLDTPESISRKHIAGRGRADDMVESDVSNRMDWFETDVLPTLGVYLNDPRYKVIHVNGNQTIDQVHKEIISKLGY